MSGTQGVAEGITHPPIDDLLTKSDSKYSLVIYAAKRARQINAYYSQLGEGLLEYVGPLVDTHVQEKSLSIAMREIEGGLLTAEQIDPAELAADVRPGTPATAVAVEAIDDTFGDPFDESETELGAEAQADVEAQADTEGDSELDSGADTEQE